MQKKVSTLPFSSGLIAERRYHTGTSLRDKFDNVYVDFDDTLVIREKVNYELISFLYKCLSWGKKIYLITRHDFDIRESLNKYRISESVFDQIYHIGPSERKHSFMKRRSIFIDNHYAERLEAYEKIGILCFDADASTFL